MFVIIQAGIHSLKLFKNSNIEASNVLLVWAWLMILCTTLLFWMFVIKPRIGIFGTKISIILESSLSHAE